jgi:endonuclease-3 related protein
MTAKAVALQGLARWELEHLDVTGVADGELRASLLAIRGVGPETADAIALYAFARPMFIADAYARRLFEQEGFTVPGGYEPFRQALRPALEQAALIAAPEAAADLAELHGLIVEEGRRRAGRPQTYLRTTRAGA